MSSLKLLEMNNEQTIEKTPETDSWIAVKPIENDSKNEIVNIVSLSIECDKVRGE